jgi:hypothetical protein
MIPKPMMATLTEENPILRGSFSSIIFLTPGVAAVLKGIVREAADNCCINFLLVDISNQKFR